jgi:hypothetical protein
MPADNVLRCRIPVKLEGVVLEQTLDVIPGTDNHHVVLQWGAAGRGMKPKLYVPISSSDFVVMDDLNFPYELSSATVIDLDSMTIQDVEEHPGDGWCVL